MIIIKLESKSEDADYFINLLFVFLINNLNNNKGQSQKAKFWTHFYIKQHFTHIILYIYIHEPHGIWDV